MYIQHKILSPASGDLVFIEINWICCIQLIFLFVKFLLLMPASLRIQQISAIEKLGKNWTWIKFTVVKPVNLHDH